MQYQRLGLSHLGRALLDQGFAATPNSTHNIACKLLTCVFAPVGLPPHVAQNLVRTRHPRPRLHRSHRAAGEPGISAAPRHDPTGRRSDPPPRRPAAHRSETSVTTDAARVSAITWQIAVDPSSTHCHQVLPRPAPRSRPSPRPGFRAPPPRSAQRQQATAPRHGPGCWRSRPR